MEEVIILCGGKGTRLSEETKLKPKPIVEIGALQKIAENKEMNAFKHYGFWQCMDNIREKNYLNELSEKGKEVWLKTKKIKVFISLMADIFHVTFIHVNILSGSISHLGRPTLSPNQMSDRFKQNFN